MVLKAWRERRLAKKEQTQRMDRLSPEETDLLEQTEKAAYIEVAKEQVEKRGRFNAYKDFPISPPKKNTNHDASIKFNGGENR